MKKKSLNKVHQMIFKNTKDKENIHSKDFLDKKIVMQHIHNYNAVRLFLDPRSVKHCL